MTKMTHAGFRIKLEDFKELILELCDEKDDVLISTIEHLIEVFNQLPDVGAELEKHLNHIKANTYGLLGDSAYLKPLSYEAAVRDTIEDLLNKLKELTSGKYNDIPSHLKDDAPFKQCDVCGRKTWSLDEMVCKMIQPDGLSICPGVFLFAENKGAAR